MITENSFLSLFESCRAVALLLLLWSGQAMLLLGVTFAITKLARSQAAEIRHKIWLVGISAVAFLPIWSGIAKLLPAQAVDNSSPEFVGFPTALFNLNGTTEKLIEQPAINWLDWLAVAACTIWLAGIIIYAVRFLISNRRMNITKRNADILTSDFYESSTQSSSQTLNIPANVKLLGSTEISNPVLAGIFRPAIIFPAGIEEWTNLSERRAIIRHELAHLERRDHFIQILQIALTAFYFFHPLVRYALDQLSFERELACDEQVINSGTATGEYMEAVLKVAEHDILKRESLYPAFTSRKQLKRRIHKLMHNHSKFLPTKWRFILLAKTTVLLAALVWFITPNNTRAQVTILEIQPVKEIQLKLQEKEELKIQVKEVPLIAIKEGQTKESAVIAIKEAQVDDEKKTAEFKALYERIKDAMLKGDKATFETLFADDFSAVESIGRKIDRQKMIDQYIGKPDAKLKLHSLDFEDMNIKIRGNVVVVTYLAKAVWLNKDTTTHKDNTFDVHSRITDIWEWKDGKWVSVISQSTEVPTWVSPESNLKF